MTTTTTGTAKARMKNPAGVLPDAVTGVQSIIKAINKGGVSQQTLELVHLRASQINGCSACVYGGIDSAKKAGVPDELLFAVSAWRETGFFSEAERAALALAEAVTRLDWTDPVPDDVWNQAAKHFDETGLASLLLMIAITNFFNRVNISVREPAGKTWA